MTKGETIRTNASGQQGGGAGAPADDLTTHNAEWAAGSRMVQSAGARTPEELETLFEDTVMVGEHEAVTGLFEEGAVLVTGDEHPARGGEEIARMALATWHGDHSYVADLRNVVQARDIALIVSEQGINVARRDHDGSWHYVVVLQAFVNERDRSTP